MPQRFVCPYNGCPTICKSRRGLMYHTRQIHHDANRVHASLYPSPLPLSPPPPSLPPPPSPPSLLPSPPLPPSPSLPPSSLLLATISITTGASSSSGTTRTT